jgi:hypothetical protein
MAQGQQAGPQRVVLDANSTQLHNAFASLYDDNTANDASTLWSKQLDAYDAEAKAGGQDPQAVSQLSDFATQFGTFVNRVTNNNVDAQTLTGQMQAQAADLTNVIAGAATNASDVFARVRTAAANAPIVAATLAEGFALQMPTRFLA